MRSRAYAVGRRGEALACWLLRAKGYRILARRFKTPVGEIDILARRGDILAAVEVKARGAASGLSQSPVSQTQWRRLARAVEWWCLCRGETGGGENMIRFDLIFMAEGRWPLHIKDAWRPGERI